MAKAKRPAQFVYRIETPDGKSIDIHGTLEEAQRVAKAKFAKWTISRWANHQFAKMCWNLTK